MSQLEEDNTISIIRMEKLLEDITNKIKLIIKHDVQTSPLLQEIIDLIDLFKTYVISQMRKTPKEECAHSINLLDYETRIAETSSEIETLQETYEEQNSNTEIFQRNITTHINNEKKIVNSIREILDMEIPREIEESMRIMLVVKQREEARIKCLQSAINLAERRLQDVMERNAVNEKKLHDMCAQIERKYIDLLAKYDCDIGASYALKEKLLEDNEVIKAETKKMEDQLIVQRELYTRFKKEWEIALIKAFTEKLEFFRQNRAAKIIQRTWRKYFERISLKKRRKARKK